jgi:hypothetical protein
MITIAERRRRVVALKKAIKAKTYDMNKAIEGSAKKIADNPETLLWR